MTPGKARPPMPLPVQKNLPCISLPGSILIRRDSEVTILLH